MPLSLGGQPAVFKQGWTFATSFLSKLFLMHSHNQICNHMKRAVEILVSVLLPHTERGRELVVLSQICSCLCIMSGKAGGPDSS